MRKLLIFILVFTFILVINRGNEGIILTCGIPLDISSFNPFDPKTYPPHLLTLIFEPLFDVTPGSYKLIPRLARYWRILNQGREWIFYLRKEIDSDDVIFSIDFWGKNDISYEKIDKHTIKLIFSKNMFSNIVSPLFIIPKNFLRGEEVRGTGPFFFKKYINSEIILEKNRENIYLNNIIIKTNYTLKDDLDIMKVPSEDFKDIENIKNYVIYNLGPNLETSNLIINQNPFSPIPKYKLAWFQNVNFRRAIAHAIDKNLIIEKVYNGYAHPQDGPLNIKSIYYTENIRKYPYNLEVSKKLLQDIGFNDRNNDGFLEDIRGNMLEINIYAIKDKEIKEIAEIIKSDLEKLKIKVNLIYKDSLSINLFQTFNWELAIVKHKWSLDPIQDSNIYLSKEAFHFWCPFQRSPINQWERQVDYLFNEFQNEKSFIKKKILLYEIQKIWAKYLPLIFIVSPYDIYIAKKNIKNFKPSLYYGPLWNSYEISK
jgi:peptide/nickel transport system substrate-binding protein